MGKEQFNIGNNMMNNIQLIEKMKDIFEFADKSPQIAELKKQCMNIRNGYSKSISQKVIDNAFDAFGVIVKKASNASDEQVKLQKDATKQYLSKTIRSNGIYIEK